MARFRLADPATADLKAILETSEARWGPAARLRYQALLGAAMRRVAAEPAGPTTLARDDLALGLRSFHLRHAREAIAGGPGGPGGQVANPVHVLYYRVPRPGLVEIVRVLHERADPVRHLEAGEEG